MVPSTRRNTATSRPAFTYPSDAYGDVKTGIKRPAQRQHLDRSRLPGAESPDGTMYKPLFACTSRTSRAASMSTRPAT